MGSGLKTALRIALIVVWLACGWQTIVCGCWFWMFRMAGTSALLTILEAFQETIPVYGP